MQDSQFKNSGHQQDWSGPDRRGMAADKTDLILSQLSDMRTGMSELRDSVTELTKSMTRLAIAEERIGQVNEALGRSFKALEKVEGRVSTLEASAPINNQASAWIMKALGAMAVAALTYGLTKGVPK